MWTSADAINAESAYRRERLVQAAETVRTIRALRAGRKQQARRARRPVDEAAGRAPAGRASVTAEDEQLHGAWLPAQRTSETGERTRRPV